MKKINLIFILTLLFISKTLIFADSNEHFKLIDTLSHNAFLRPAIILRTYSDEYFIINKIPFSNSIFILYNYPSGLRTYLDSNDYNKYFANIKLGITSGIYIDGKIILSGTINGSLVLFENNNGIRGEWKQVNIYDSVVTNYTETYLYYNENNKNKLFLYAYSRGSNSYIFISEDRGNTWFKSKIILPFSFADKRLLVISNDILYTSSYKDFIKINLLTNEIQTTEVIKDSTNAHLYFISNLIFKDEKNGIIEVSGEDFIENDSLKSKLSYYQTKDGGDTWQKISEFSLLGGFYNNYFYYTNNNILKAFNDNYELIESKDFGESWIINHINLKKGVPLSLMGYSPIVEGEKYLVISNVKVYEFNEQVNSINERKEDIDDFILCPNPSNGNIYLHNINERSKSFEIINQLGISLIKGNIANEIDVSALPAGIYFLKIDNEKVKKFIKI